MPWVQAFLTGRTTKIRMPEGVSEAIPTPTGIPQGSPISPILYLIYNADLIEGSTEAEAEDNDIDIDSNDATTATNNSTSVTINGWVDDTSILVTGDSEQTNLYTLQKESERTDVWARRHASVFDVKKYAICLVSTGYNQGPGVYCITHHEKCL